MWIGYLDESGCAGTYPALSGGSTPVLVIACVAIREATLSVFSTDFMDLKRTFFPGLLRSAKVPVAGGLGAMLVEIKGTNIRAQLRSTDQRERRQAYAFLHNLLALLERHGARIFGRVWVKALGAPIDGRALYTSSVQAIFTTFQNLLDLERDTGIVIADSRNQSLNVPVAHSIFTQKHRVAGDPYSRLLEVPLFGHSHNHAGIQVADLLASAFLFPMATSAYCGPHGASTHTDPLYHEVRLRFGDRVRELQHRFMLEGAKWQGGITVSDSVSKKPGGALFRP